jgi:uncharacterized protein (DUF305 family)
MKQFVTSVTLPYFVYLMYFLGVGFLGGAIVHFPVNPNLYGIIGLVGAIIFTVASTLNEWLTNKRHVLQEGVIKIILYSLVLSIGLGMISGGIQHFVDFPVYASYLIPGGFIISLIGYVLNKEIKLDMTHKLLLIGKISLISIPLFLVLNTWAKTMDISAGGHAHGAANESTTTEESIVHSTEVTNDEEFINQMIPHHQEAIDTSNIVISKSKNTQIKQFAEDVINVQTSEVNQMKGWYSTWFGKEYAPHSNYMPMMGSLMQLNGEELEKEYITGMIAHHKGAIDMAKQILATTQRPEIKKMAEVIISVQAEEVNTLQNTLEGYDHEESEHMNH